MSDGLKIVGDSEEYEASETDLEVMKEVGFEPPKEEEKPETPKEEVKEPTEVVDDAKVEEVKEVIEERTPKFVDLEKHKKMRDRAQTAEKEIEDLKLKLEQKTDVKVEEIAVKSDDELQKIADEMGVTIESVKKLHDIAEASATQKVESKFQERFKNLEAVADSVKQKEETLVQEKIWDKQFGELKDKFPNEDIESKKAQLKELAFSKQYSKTPLDVIYRGYDGLRETKKKTVEGGTGGTSKGEGDVVDFKEVVNLPEAEMNRVVQAMNSDTFEKFGKYLEVNKL